MFRESWWGPRLRQGRTNLATLEPVRAVRTAGSVYELANIQSGIDSGDIFGGRVSRTLEHAQSIAYTLRPDP
jgi:hypothetical protein